MIINSQNLNLVFSGFQAKYTDAHLAAPSYADKIAMTVPSSSRDETYSWLGQFPRLREWIGPRHVNNLKAHGFTIKNITFASTVAVPRNDIADDRIGIFAPMFSEMGRDAKTHPDELIFDLLKKGFVSDCFDGQNFFDTDHPIELVPGEEPVSVSNMQSGTDPAWFLLDVSRGVRPVIWQEREKYEFQSITAPNDSHVIMHDEYIYGVRARVNAGFGLWQLAFGSKAELNETNYAAARASMMNFKSDGGRLLGVKPSIMVVPPELEDAALHLLNTETKDGGGSNPWKNTVDLIVTPYVA